MNSHARFLHWSVCLSRSLCSLIGPSASAYHHRSLLRSGSWRDAYTSYAGLLPGRLVRRGLPAGEDLKRVGDWIIECAAEDELLSRVTAMQEAPSG